MVPYAYICYPGLVLFWEIGNLFVPLTTLYLVVIEFIAMSCFFIIIYFIYELSKPKVV